MRKLSTEQKVGWMPRGLGRKKGKPGEGELFITTCHCLEFCCLYSEAAQIRSQKGRALPQDCLPGHSLSYCCFPAICRSACCWRLSANFQKVSHPCLCSHSAYNSGCHFILHARPISETKSTKLCTYPQTVNAVKALCSHWHQGLKGFSKKKKRGQ